MENNSKQYLSKFIRLLLTFKFILCIDEFVLVLISSSAIFRLPQDSSRGRDIFCSWMLVAAHLSQLHSDLLIIHISFCVFTWLMNIYKMTPQPPYQLRISLLPPVLTRDVPAPHSQPLRNRVEAAEPMRDLSRTSLIFPCPCHTLCPISGRNFAKLHPTNLQIFPQK